MDKYKGNWINVSLQLKLGDSWLPVFFNKFFYSSENLKTEITYNWSNLPDERQMEQVFM